MAITSIATVNNILNRVAVEVGLDPVEDPFASQEQHFVQMRFLLQTAGEELSLLHDWEFLRGAHQIVTSDTDSGEYDLPDDFLMMTNQTGWEHNANVPIAGPLSAQEWTYLEGRDLVSHTLYASFRIMDGKFNIYPQPVPNDLDLRFEYKSRNWVQVAGDPTTNKADIGAGGDKPLFDRTLVSRFLKVMWLEAKGFDTAKAQTSVNQVFGFVTGGEKGAPVLNQGRRSLGFPYLDARYNTPDTGYGN